MKTWRGISTEPLNSLLEALIHLVMIELLCIKPTRSGYFSNKIHNSSTRSFTIGQGQG